VDERTRRRYRDWTEGYVAIEVSHVGQNVYPQATVLALGTTVVGAFRDERVAELLHSDRAGRWRSCRSGGSQAVEQTVRRSGGWRGRPGRHGEFASTFGRGDAMSEVAETGCCPRFDPSKWEGKELTWQDKLFVRDRVRSVFHIPLNFGGVMKRTMQAIEAADALDPDQLVLSDENSLWGADVYIAVAKDVPGARMERLSGKYLVRTFEGPYSKAGVWAKDVTTHLANRGEQAKKLYFWYTTCPRCAKAYGKNYVAVVAERASA
jgi:hypothetical protein